MAETELPPSVIPQDWVVRRPDQVVKPSTFPSAADVVDWGKSAAFDLPRIGADAATYGAAPVIMGAGQHFITGEPFKEALADQLARNEAAKAREGPFWSTAAELAGGGATAGGLRRLGVSAVGRFTGSPIRTLAAGASEGAIHGGLQGAGHSIGGDPGDVATNTGVGMGMGGVLGLGAPLAGGLAGAATRYVSGQRSGVPDFVTKAAVADQAGLRTVPNTPDAMLVDAGPSMRSVGQAAFSGGAGPGHSALETALRTRDEGVQGRIANVLDQNAGRAVVPSFEQAGIRTRMEGMSPEYQRTLLNARAVDTEPIANWMDAEIINSRGPAQEALTRARRMLDIHGNPGVLDPHPEALQQTRIAIRGMRDDPNTTDRNARAALTDVYNRITRELHDKVPGMRELDSRYAELGQQEAALAHTSPGSRIFETDKASVMRPVEFAQYMSEAGTPKGINAGPSLEPVRAQQAVRAELDRLVGTNLNDLNTLKRVLATPQDWNAQKLEIAFGPDRARNIMDLMAREPGYRESYQKIVHGSQTDPRAAAREAFDAGAGDIPTNVTLFGTAMRGLQKGVDSLRFGAGAEARDRIAAQLATRDPVRMRAIADSWMRMGHERGQQADAIRDLVTSGIIGGGAASTVPPFVLK